MDALNQGFCLGDAVVKPKDGSLEFLGQGVHISPRAMGLLLCLAGDAGEVVPKERLRACNDSGKPCSDSTLTNLVAELRLALRDDKQSPRYIATHPGKGYRLIPSPKPLSLGLWYRLRQSRVIKLSAAFFIIAWLLLQVAAVLFPMLDAPPVIYKLVVLGLTLALPSVLAFSWIRELKQRHRYAKGGGHPLAGDVKQRRLEGMAIVSVSLLALFISAHLVERINETPPNNPVDAVRTGSIAVLPLVGSVDVPRHFMDGVQRDLTTMLSSSKQLKVASLRTVVGVEPGMNMAQLRDRLRVQYVVEGRVWHQAESLQLELHISETDGGFQVWHQQFSGEQDDLLDLSRRLGRQLWAAVALLLPEVQIPGAPPILTDDVTAYDQYLVAMEAVRDAPSESQMLEAEQLLLDALRRDPGFANAAIGLCVLYQALFDKTKTVSHFDSALQACGRASDLDTSPGPASLALAGLYYTRGDRDEAWRRYQAVLDEVPDSAEALSGLAKLAMRSGQSVEADGLFRQAIEAEPGYWRNYQNYGTFLFSSGEYRPAAEQYRRVTVLKPDYAVGFNNLGSAHYLAGEMEPALVAWRRAMELAPTPSSYSNMGTYYFFNGMFPEAAAMYDMAIALRPDEYLYRANRAEAMKFVPGAQAESQQGFQLALSLVKEHEAINDDDPELLAQKGRYLAELGQCGSAREHRRRLLSQGTEDPYIYYDLALSASACNESEQVMGFLQRALELGYPPALVDRDPQFEAYRSEIRATKDSLGLARQS